MYIYEKCLKSLHGNPIYLIKLQAKPYVKKFGGIEFTGELDGEKMTYQTTSVRNVGEDGYVFGIFVKNRQVAQRVAELLNDLVKLIITK
jgi:hypothetical protein